MTDQGVLKLSALGMSLVRSERRARWPALLILLLFGCREGHGASLAAPAQSTLDLLGHRADKNAVGHGRNVALYTGNPSKFFFATHSLGDVFSATDGETMEWFPDHVRINPVSVNRPDDRPMNMQQHEVCVTQDDVVVARVHLVNPLKSSLRHRIEIQGDCTKSFDWREKPGGEKKTERQGDIVLLRDKNVFPAFVQEGLCMAIGGSIKPREIMSATAGTYRMVFELDLPAKAARDFTLACAISTHEGRAIENLRAVLKQRDPIAENRQAWATFFDQKAPRFRCSDHGLEELYAFRWFLLRFSTAGGELGYFKYPVVLEGRQAYQTYCCYSAPFMAFDLNWAPDPQLGFGHIMNMVEAAYDDGRFPWYCSPRTNRVTVHHESRTGLSLLPHAAWKHYLIHGDRKLLRQLYPGMKKNLQWWIKARDADGNGLFQIAHQYETGMDDLHRWGAQSMSWHYDAVDATSYAYINLRAVEQMAIISGEASDAKYFADYADKTAHALNSFLWREERKSWHDRHPQTKELADVLAITTFYPFYAGAADREHMDVFRKHLLNPEQFWLPYPVPALAKDQPDFKPDGFWQGPSWPAATTHVLEAFATSAKQLDRSLLPQAAELFRRAAYVHLQPRADFHERYNPVTGKPLSQFRDYMHSWWIDLFICHVAGLMPQQDGSLVIDPLPMGLDYFSLEGAPYRGKIVDVLWLKPNRATDGTNGKSGLTVRVNGKIALRRPNFQPGEAPIQMAFR